MDECASGRHHKVGEQPVCHSNTIKDLHLYYIILNLYVNIQDQM